MTALRQRMIQDMQIRNLSPRTIECYIYHVACFAEHFGRSPEELGPEQVRQYQVYLVQEKQASWSSFNQAVCALRFLYGTTLGRRDYLERLPCERAAKKGAGRPGGVSHGADGRPYSPLRRVRRHDAHV